MKSYLKLLLSASVIVVYLVTCSQKDISPRKKITEAAHKGLNAIEHFQRNGGWAMAWTQDKSATFGEWLLREDDIITVQPPATPGIGSVFLKAFKVLNDSVYLQKAVAAGDALRSGQLDNGGFTHEFYPDKKKQDSTWFQHYGPNGEAWFPPNVEGSDIFLRSQAGTFDDATTQFSIQFFLRLWQTTGMERFKKAAEKGAAFMLDAQYSNGGWPQEYPLQDDYTRFITLNDNAMMDVMRTLFMCSKVMSDSNYFYAALRGANCLLKLQGGSKQEGWAQQYTREGKPASARPWEPAALSGSESVEVIKLLKMIYLLTGNRKYLEAGQRAIDWLKDSRLENGKWARFYEIGTNKPVYGGPNDKITYNLDVALHLHPGYSWTGNYLKPSLIEEYNKLLNAPVDKRKMIEKKMAPQESLEDTREEALAAASSLNEQGFWTSKMKGERLEFYQKKFGKNSEPPKLIDSGDFTDNMNSLLHYLERINQKK